MQIQLTEESNVIRNYDLKRFVFAILNFAFMISDSVFKKSSFSSVTLTGLYNISICMLVQYLIQLQLILPLGANSNKGARISNSNQLDIFSKLAIMYLQCRNLQSGLEKNLWINLAHNNDSLSTTIN